MKADGTTIRDNSRGPQPLNNRPVSKIDVSVPAPPNLDYSPSTGCVKKVVTGDYFDARFGVANVFQRNDAQPVGSFWLGPSNTTGSFIIDLGCQKQRNGLELVNVQYEERATKQFKLFSSSSYMGPWTELVEEEMAQNESFPFHNYTFPSTTDQFYKFEILSYHGNGGGLQYLDVKGFFIVHFSQTNINPPQKAKAKLRLRNQMGRSLATFLLLNFQKIWFLNMNLVLDLSL